MIQKLIFLFLISFAFVQPTLAVDSETIGQEFAPQFQSLSAKEQSQFLEKRTAILNGLRAGLNKARFVFI